MRIAIVTPSLTTADAVSNDVLGMYDVLRKHADVRIFSDASTVETPRIEPVRKLKHFLTGRDDTLIYHHSGGWEPAMQLLTANCRKVVKYHNITPPEFFSPYSEHLARLCESGRRQLAAIAKADCHVFLSDSAYNMGELIAAGADESKNFVVPPFHRVDLLQDTETDSASGPELQNGVVNVSTVGRMAPNKGHADLIAGFAIYHHDHNPHSRLVFVGKQETRLIKYSAMLHGLIKQLRLNHAVSFADNVSDRALKCCYHAADVFAMTSEHEGFCVPLVEAMAMGVPIVAYASTAVTETIGSAGIVWEERKPQLLAESIDFVVTRQQLRNALIETGERRYKQQFTNQRIAEKLMNALASVLDR